MRVDVAHGGSEHRVEAFDPTPDRRGAVIGPNTPHRAALPGSRPQVGFTPTSKVYCQLIPRADVRAMAGPVCFPHI
jgi:hypothetical protein